MRIVGGEFRGRRFNPPAKNWPTRPTTDFSKEGLFNILQNRIDFEDSKMLDLFGGTGNHSYEFISRGCVDVTYVDKFGGCVDFVKKTAEALDISERIKIVKQDVFKYIRTCQSQYDYIFAGPPYPHPILAEIPDEIFKHELLVDGGIFVLEHSAIHDFTNHERFIEVRTYGGTIFSFFK